MAYGTQCGDNDVSCTRLLRYSNPRQTWGGDPLGVPADVDSMGADGPADAAAVLNATGSAVARWRDRPARANRPPAAVGTLPDRRLTLHGALTVDVSPAFVDPDGDPLIYSVSSSAPDVVTVLAAGARVTLTAVGEGAAAIRVTATDPGGLSATQAFTVTVAAMRAPFTDDPIVPGVTPIKAVHFTELRTRIAALRAAAGLAPFRWTDPVLRPGVTRVRLVHLLELREALGAAYAAAGRTAPQWTDAVPLVGSTPIRAAHLTELRTGVVALETNTRQMAERRKLLPAAASESAGSESRARPFADAASLAPPAGAVADCRVDIQSRWTGDSGRGSSPGAKSPSWSLGCPDGPDDPALRRRRQAHRRPQPERDRRPAPVEPRSGIGERTIEGSDCPCGFRC